MSPDSTPVEAIIALGGNLGDVRASFIGARAMLAAEPDILLLASSKLYQTPPMGPQDQPDYLNAAIVVKTSLSPLALLHELQAIELHFGRKRDGQRWGERTLDLDLLAYDDMQMQSAELTLPHPGMRERLFVLQPLRDIRPDWIHPMTGECVDDMVQAIIQAGDNLINEGEVW